MNEGTTTPCATGCTIHGKHGTACPNLEACTACTCHQGPNYPCSVPGGCHPHHQACRGCLPRPVQGPDVVCERCRSQLDAALIAIPDLVGWVRYLRNGTTGTTETVGEARPPVGKRDAAPTPLNITAVDDADGLYVTALAWMERHTATHPCGLAGITRPETRWRPAGVQHRTPDVHTPTCPVDATGRHGRRVGGTWWPCHGCASTPIAAAPTGLHPTTAPAAVAATRPVARWLRSHLPWAVQQPWAGEYVRDVTRHVRAVDERWPIQVADLELNTPCPACDYLTLRWHPPTFYRGPIVVRCHHPACGITITEREYGLYRRIVLDYYANNPEQLDGDAGEEAADLAEEGTSA